EAGLAAAPAAHWDVVGLPRPRQRGPAGGVLALRAQALDQASARPGPAPPGGPRARRQAAAPPPAPPGEAAAPPRHRRPPPPPRAITGGRSPTASITAASRSAFS